MTTLKIEKMIYGGDGLARLTEDTGRSKAVFVPFVLPGEEIEAKIVEHGRGFSRAAAEKIITPSAQRVEPKCPYFQRCGGCHYQHAAYEKQLEIKNQILRETFLRTAKFDWPDDITTYSAEAWNYRNRTRMKVRGGKNFAIGYYRFASHDLLSVEQCPISSPLINRTLEAIWNIGRSGVVPPWLAEIEFFANSQDDQVMLEFYLSGEADLVALDKIARQLRAADSAIIGITAFAGRANQPAKKIWTDGSAELVYRTRNDSYRVRAGSFFQTNRHLTEKLVELVSAAQTGGFALDLYAGTGLFSLPLARTFKRVSAVEAAPDSYADLRTNAPANVECRRATTEDFLKGKIEINPDLIVADPPRAGVGEKVTRDLIKLAAKSVVYVSCDPATLARDLRELILGGYKVKSIALIDLFPQTFHIETVVHLAL